MVMVMVRVTSTLTYPKNKILSTIYIKNAIPLIYSDI